jgi:type II secretory pathway component PulF
MRLEELASQLDAGIPAGVALEHAGSGTTAQEVGGGITEALAGAGIVLRPTEIEALRAAERGGGLASGLRRCARIHRERAELARAVWARLRYPALVLLTAIPAATLAGAVTGHRGRLLAVILALPLLGLLLAVVARRLVRKPTFSGRPIRALAGLLQDAGEIPYLEALGALYAAGVPVVEAHATAVRAVAVANVRARLFHAGETLAQQRIPLADALARTQAVDPETLHILRAGEHAGDLEGALARALERRRQSLHRRSTTAIAVAGGLVYAAVVGVVVWIVFDFYGGLYGRLHR